MRKSIAIANKVDIGKCRKKEKILLQLERREKKRKNYHSIDVQIRWNCMLIPILSFAFVIYYANYEFCNLIIVMGFCEEDTENWEWKSWKEMIFYSNNNECEWWKRKKKT